MYAFDSWQAIIYVAVEVGESVKYSTAAPVR
jgi:hypothetical protein